MSRQSEVEKIIFIISDVHSGNFSEAKMIAKSLVDNKECPIRSKDGFEIDDECINDKGREYHVFIKPKEYKEEHGD